MDIKRLSILGSTGSIGTSTLDVVRRFPGRFEVLALAAGKNVGLLAKQIKEFSPIIVSVTGNEEKKRLQKELCYTEKPKIVFGSDGLKELASLPDADIIVIAISGSWGLLPTYWALSSGHDVALANKESLVMAGQIITRLARSKGVNILPVDSEHSAIFHCLLGRKREDASGIVLTASGGPFRNYSLSQMEAITPEMALEHPVWHMGRKVTLDSSTMMNKGLEVIEAKWLFDFPSAKIKVLVHPESIVHSMVEYKDGSVIALLSMPDMRLPIMQALSFPDTLLNELPGLDLGQIGKLTFSAPDMERFQCLGLAYQALEGEDSLPVVLNAANEVAGEAFFEKRIGYLDIPKIIKACFKFHKPRSICEIEDTLEVDQRARDTAKRILEGEMQ